MLNADNFIECWEQFCQDFVSENIDWLVLYESSTGWTARFLGGKKSGSKTSPIGNFFQQKFSGLRYRTEDGSFDLSFSLAPNYSQLPHLCKGNISHFDVEGFFPTHYDAIIEIENEYKRAWQEMIKLTWVRSSLKVLVTYNWPLSDKSIWQTQNKVLIDTFSRIIHLSNENFDDNSQTEYLLIIGNNDSRKLNWTYNKFDSKGQIIAKKGS